MTEEYELASFDRHSLNFDNVALGRLPTSVTTDPSVIPLRELGYLPQGSMDPHNVPQEAPRAGKLPTEMVEWLSDRKSSTSPKQVDKPNSIPNRTNE